MFGTPVLILALDTTTRGGSTAVLHDDRALAVVDGDATRTHGERLPPEIAAALDAAGQAAAAMDLIAVARGPGAFTGLRIGLATAQGLALTLGLPVVGVPALEALAETAAAHAALPPGTIVGAWMDAARGEVFAALYRVAEPRAGGAVCVEVAGPTAMTPADTLAAWEGLVPAGACFTGEGAIRYLQGTGRRVVTGVPALAPAIGRIGRRLAADGQAGPPHALQPLYIRRPDVVIERERRQPS
ncbi:MAG: tRNA (adenosine(37)-N6)-threonylcarbamoyltransferase complex dimerization subunit type 1 TsaB [Vicinamibacterales bacterium]